MDRNDFYEHRQNNKCMNAGLRPIDKDGTVHCDSLIHESKWIASGVDSTEIDMEIDEIPGILQAITLAYHHREEVRAINFWNELCSLSRTRSHQ